MALELLAVAISLSAASLGGPFPNFASADYRRMDDGRRLATRAPYQQGRADDVRRPGFNGRLWLGERFIGGETPDWSSAAYQNWAGPGPTAYGAVGAEMQTVYARVGQLAIGINPWEAFHAEGLGELEAARNEWLKERGYVGGVRTFVNDLYVDRFMAPMGQRQSVVTPRATIEMPADMPRFRSREQVMHEMGSVKPAVKAYTRVSLPPMAPLAMTERLSMNRVVAKVVK
jgi:hypothetical protein